MDERALVADWHRYWGYHFPRHRPDDKEDFVAREIVELIDLTRYQVRRKLARKPERWALEALAEKLRDEGTLSGRDATRVIRAAYECGMAHMEATGFD